MAFVLAGLLVVIAVPLIFRHDTGAVAGWNIFLGLLLAGAVGSGYRQAPRIAIGIAALMVIRIIVSVLFVPMTIGLLVDMLLAAMAAIVAQDLFRQARDRRG
jgi:hypothetical protein